MGLKGHTQNSDGTFLNLKTDPRVWTQLVNGDKLIILNLIKMLELIIQLNNWVI